jgi:hypothetical protein
MDPPINYQFIHFHFINASSFLWDVLGIYFAELLLISKVLFLIWLSLVDMYLQHLFCPCMFDQQIVTFDSYLLPLDSIKGIRT